MNKYADRASENNIRNAASSTPKLQGNTGSASQLVGNGAGTVAQQRLQDPIHNDSRAGQLKAYQEMTNQSQHVKQLRAYQAMANHFTSSAGAKPLQFMAEPTELNLQPALKPVQRMMKKLGVDKEKYRKMTMSTVFLYAEFEGEPIGIFSTQKGNHAEENLIEYLIKQGLKNGSLVVYLSTSPCSSLFCTRDDGKEGCQERLTRLKSERNITVTVHADHLYQPQALVSQEAELGSKGFSSYSSASTSDFKMTFSSLPNKLKSPEMMDGFDQAVAQL